MTHKRKSRKKKGNKKKEKKMIGKPDILTFEDLFKPGNNGLARLLLVLEKAGPSGISTNVLLKDELRSSHYAQTTIKKAYDMGLIDRIDGEPPGPGQFCPRFNVLTEKGRKLLKSALE